MKEFIPGTIYRYKESSQAKDALCQVICQAEYTDGKPLVIYQELSGNFAVRAAGVAEFLELFSAPDFSGDNQSLQQAPVPAGCGKVQESREEASRLMENNCEEAPESTEHSGEKEQDSGTLDRDLTAFLDASDPGEKLELLYPLKKRLNEYLMSSIEISMDLPVGTGSLEERLELVRRHLQTVAKYESGGRLR